MKKVLLVDDSRAIHAVVTEMLPTELFQLHHAHDGRDGLSLLEKLCSSQNRPDLILLDWEMPHLSGPEFLQEFVTKAYTIPVIMLTSKNEVQDISEILRSGASEYIMKPFTKELILEKIEMTIGTM